MKLFLSVAGLMALLAVSAPSNASIPEFALAAKPTTFEHGGGCRKDSPPGQCCHAGSQPFHCH